MKTIWKYELALANFQTIPIVDRNATPLCVAEQNGKCFIWIEHDNSLSDNALVSVHIFGTGHRVHSGAGRYVGTIHAGNGLVWHVYAQTNI